MLDYAGSKWKECKVLVYEQNKQVSEKFAVLNLQLGMVPYSANLAHLYVDCKVTAAWYTFWEYTKEFNMQENQEYQMGHWNVFEGWIQQQCDEEYKHFKKMWIFLVK